MEELSQANGSPQMDDAEPIKIMYAKDPNMVTVAAIAVIGRKLDIIR